jgi:hypothetical protein
VWPMPRAAPVISATLSLSLSIASFRLGLAG